MRTIPDIRERDDRLKDKQPKHQATSTVQRQMVQKFIKELGDNVKQSDRSDSAERTATEQIETTAHEIVHEAVQLPRRAIQHPAHKESADSSAGVQPEQSDQPRQRAEVTRTRQESRQPQSAPPPTPQEQARRSYIRQTAKASTAAKAPERSTIPDATPIEKQPRQRRKRKTAVPMSKRQRNPAQRNRLRGIIFMQSSRKSGLRMICCQKNCRRSAKSQMCRKSVVSYNPKPHKKNHPQFVI